MNDLPVFELQGDEPLYPKVLWNRPVARTGAGRLLVPGGHTGQFSMVTSIHQVAQAAGAGACVAMLPDSLIAMLGGAPETVFVPSTPSGSIHREGLGRLLELASDSDAVLLGANLSQNSLTTILIERFLAESTVRVVAFAEAFSSLQHNPGALAGRKGALLIMTMPELIALAKAISVKVTVKDGGGLVNKLEIVRTLAQAIPGDIVVYGNETIVSVDGRLGVSASNYRLAQLPALAIAILAVFWVQNTARPYEGLMTGANVMTQLGDRLFATSTARPALQDATAEIRQILGNY